VSSELWLVCARILPHKLAFGIETGDNYSDVATPLSDAVLALEVSTGKIIWSKQTTPGDVRNALCSTKGNAPDPLRLRILSDS